MHINITNRLNATKGCKSSPRSEEEKEEDTDDNFNKDTFCMNNFVFKNWTRKDNICLVYYFLIVNLTMTFTIFLLI